MPPTSPRKRLRHHKPKRRWILRTAVLLWATAVGLSCLLVWKHHLNHHRLVLYDSSLPAAPDASDNVASQQQQQQQQEWLRRTTNSFPNPLVRRPECTNFDHSIPTPTHGCQVNTDTYLIYCHFQKLRLRVDRISSDPGGEALTRDIMGRPESNELPRYQKGAFAVAQPPKFQVPEEYRIHMHYLADVLNNLVYPTKKNKGEIGDTTTCAETWSGTTLLLTRYEYANLYHTMTDWWNAFSILPQPQQNKIRIIFLDGHAQGILDPVWKHVFGDFTYVQQLPKHGNVCLEHAVLIPPGYLAPPFPSIHVNRARCPNRRQAQDFANHFVHAYGLQNVHRIPGNVVIIDRQHYVAHPRSQPQSLQRILTELPTLQTALQALDRVTSVSLVQLETMSFEEQLRTIREAHVVIGNHGAGLTHVLFMEPQSTLVEFSADAHDFFVYLSEWKEGVSHVPIPIANPNRLEPEELHKAVQVVRQVLAAHY